MKRIGRVICAIGVAALLFVLGARVASAHATLVRTNPPDLCSVYAPTPLSPGDPRCASGTILATPPNSIQLLFSEPIHAVRHGLVVIAPSGRHVEQGAVQADATVLSVAVAAHEEGTYQVLWQVIGDDTHPEQGSFLFSVGHAGPVAAATAIAPPDLGGVTALGLVLQVIARWLHFCGYALAFGPLVFRLWVLSPKTGLHSEKADARLWRMVAVGIGLLLFAELIALLGQTASLGADRIFDVDAMGDMFASSFGRVLAQRVGAAILLWVLMGIIRQGYAVATWLALVLGVGLAVVDGQTSHAITAPPVAISLAVNTGHIVAMGVWIGGIAALLALWRLPEYEKRRALLVGRLGRLAGAAFVWLVVTGVAMAWLHLRQPDDLVTTVYGRALTLKLCLVLAVVLMAMTALRVRTEFRARWWALEVAALLAVITLAGLLISLPPPA